jgi:hypothetical protein
VFGSDKENLAGMNIAQPDVLGSVDYMRMAM